jgi:uncharacterized coiled-coil protein SlyX
MAAQQTLSALAANHQTVQDSGASIASLAQKLSEPFGQLQAHYRKVAAATRSVQAVGPAQIGLKNATIRRQTSELDAKGREITTWETRHRELEMDLRASQDTIDNLQVQVTQLTQDAAWVRDTLNGMQDIIRRGPRLPS